MLIRDFIVELVNRLRAKSPKFFQVLQWTALGTIVFGHLPWFIEHYTYWTLPEKLISLCHDIATRAEGFLLAVMLPKRDAAVAQTTEGEAVKVTNEKKMPFTAKEEAKSVSKMEPPPPTATDVHSDK